VGRNERGSERSRFGVNEVNENRKKANRE